MLQNESDTRIALRFRMFKISRFVIIERRNGAIRSKRREIPIAPLVRDQDWVGILLCVYSLAPLCDPALPLRAPMRVPCGVGFWFAFYFILEDFILFFLCFRLIFWDF